MLFARASLLRASIRAAGSTARRPAQQLARRTYASGQSHEAQKSSDLPWLLGSVGLGGPALFYLIQSRPQKKPHDHGEGHHGDAEKKEAEAPAGEAEPQPDRDAEQKTDQSSAPKSDQGADAEKPTSRGEPPSNADQPDTRKEPSDPGSTSAKQEGISNTTTDNPYVNEQGKSVKGEGETETAKVKGTVAPERPQA